jgi:glycosyltransferase involved in cell wall biosynthesis
MEPPMRIAIFSHGHPSFSKGGGELAAWHLFEGINAGGAHQAWFIARAPREMLHPGTPVAALNEREYLIGGNAEIPDLCATIALGPDSDFAALLRTIRPDVIHFQHYVHLGLEMIRAARRTCPDAKIVLTLHEYIAICMNSGQMLKTDGRLCHRYSPRECAQCFPERAPEDFFLRERYIKAHFDLVDRFISPSRFLKERYVAWGLPAVRIEVLENGIPDGQRQPPRTLAADEARGRFAYFGQINPFKGVDVLLEAIALLPKRVRRRMSLDIFGSGLDSQPAVYRERVTELLADNARTVRLHGAYEPHEMEHLLAGIDWVLMGSVWWENSPLVIQEAFRAGRPVICPGIGGMAEKVQDGSGGYHYRASDPVALAGLIRTLVEDPAKFDRVLDTLPAVAPRQQCVDSHLALYAAS